MKRMVRFAVLQVVESDDCGARGENLYQCVRKRSIPVESNTALLSGEGVEGWQQIDYLP